MINKIMCEYVTPPKCKRAGLSNIPPGCFEKWNMCDSLYQKYHDDRCSSLWNTDCSKVPTKDLNKISKELEDCMKERERFQHECVDKRCSDPGHEWAIERLRHKTRRCRNLKKALSKSPERETELRKKEAVKEKQTEELLEEVRTRKNIRLRKRKPEDYPYQMARAHLRRLEQQEKLKKEKRAREEKARKTRKRKRKKRQKLQMKKAQRRKAKEKEIQRGRFVFVEEHDLKRILPLKFGKTKQGDIELYITRLAKREHAEIEIDDSLFFFVLFKFPTGLKYLGSGNTLYEAYYSLLNVFINLHWQYASPIFLKKLKRMFPAPEGYVEYEPSETEFTLSFDELKFSDE